MKKLKTICLLVIVHLMFALAGCGSGGGGNGNTTPTKAVVKLSTQGVLTAPSIIGGVELTLILPAGVTVNVKSDGTGTANSGVVVASGVATGADVYTGTYTAATASTEGTLKIRIANSQTGFGVGEFATITCDLASGLPKETDFKIKSDNPDDYVIFNLTDSAHISGISIVNTVELK